MGAVAAMALQVQPISLPTQKHFEGRPFPLVLKPGHSGPHGEQVHANGHMEQRQAAAGLPGLTLADVVAWVRTNKASLEAQLKEHGAILFRGFPVASPSDFNAVVEAFEWEEFPYIGGAAPRSNVFGRVFTSNESPPDQKIPFHHEMAQVPEYPAKLFFYCDVEAGEQGETPLLLSNIVTQQMEQRRPEFVQQLREKGLVYTRVLPEVDDPTSAIGRGWISTYHTTNKSEAEQRAKKLGVSLEWLPNGCVKTVTSVLPGVKKDQATGRVAWFNSMVAAYTGWKDSRNVPENAVTFGDGTPLPPDAVQEVMQVMDDISVANPWVKGDVLLIDNHTVQHARRTFVPPRRVLAALTK